MTYDDIDITPEESVAFTPQFDTLSFQVRTAGANSLRMPQKFTISR